MMAPKRYGGLEMDLDTFFEVVLELSTADASMGWLIGFYIEHNFWYCHYPQQVQDSVYGKFNYALAPATLNIAGALRKKWTAATNSMAAGNGAQESFMPLG